MKVKNHRLYENGDPVKYVSSPNYSGEIIEHEYLVMHYTAGTSVDSSIAWLTNRRAQASAHLVIARDGSITQLVPFNKVAWHAGRSAWGSRVGLNRYSIGIELDNAGILTKRLTHWANWSGKKIPEDEVIVKRHKNDEEESGWQSYGDIQLEVAMEVASVLANKYEFIDVVGHDDIAPGRKRDPGPAFPMASFRAHVFGRSGDEDGLYKTTTNLNIRSGPGTEYEMLPGSPLPKGSELLISENVGNWRFVDVLDEVNGVADLEGWVHGRYLEKT